MKISAPDCVVPPKDDIKSRGCEKCAFFKHEKCTLGVRCLFKPIKEELKMKIDICSICGVEEALTAAIKLLNKTYVTTSGACYTTQCDQCYWYTGTRSCAYDEVMDSKFVLSNKDFDLLLQYRKNYFGVYQTWLHMLVVYINIAADLNWWIEFTAFKPVISDIDVDGERIVMLTYRQLIDIYDQYRLSEDENWKTFCDWIRRLPYHELITEEFV